MGGFSLCFVPVTWREHVASNAGDEHPPRQGVTLNIGGSGPFREATPYLSDWRGYRVDRHRI